MEDATEVDVDAIADGTDCVIMGIMEHIEEAGVHSGDSACAIPPFSLTQPVLQEIREATSKLAMKLNVIGLMNIQFAVKQEEDGPALYVLEVNPRASRTAPFVAKATGVPVANIATKVMTGMKLRELGRDQRSNSHVTCRSKRACFHSASLLAWTSCWGRRCEAPAK